MTLFLSVVRATPTLRITREYQSLLLCAIPLLRLGWVQSAMSTLHFGYITDQISYSLKNKTVKFKGPTW